MVESEIFLRSVSGRNLIGCRYAVKAALLSDFRHHRVGAALLIKSRVIGIGWNVKKTHPECPNPRSMHAEFSTCVGSSKEDLKRATLYVVRVTRSGLVGIAKPCNECREFIKLAGINKTYFSNRDGILEEMYD